MPNLATDLARVMELLEKATPGFAMMKIRVLDHSIYVSIGESSKGPHTQGDVHLPEDDVRAMVQAINFLRQHGPYIAETFKETPNG